MSMFGPTREEVTFSPQPTYNNRPDHGIEKICPPESSGSLIFRDLDVYGFDTRLDHQETFLNYPQKVAAQLLCKVLGRMRRARKTILHKLQGVVLGGEMLLVLGRPGSGCTTLLKSLTGDTHGLQVDPNTQLSFSGKVTRGQMKPTSTDHADGLFVPGESMADTHAYCRGEYAYLSDSDIHFAHLTVRQTLDFASRAGSSSKAMSQHDCRPSAAKSVEGTVNSLGLAQTLDTKVGDSFTRGISGGERKRTSIAEVLVGASHLQCWDNSIRGLDSANALQFVQTLRSNTSESKTVAVATLYQASEDIYTCFDKVMLLYEGQEIYFGPATRAKLYFMDLGFLCPERSTTADFLCSITNPKERITKQGFENRVPRNAAEFVKAWYCSPGYAELNAEIQRYPQTRLSQNDLTYLSRQRTRTPYMITFPQQVQLCMVRGFQRLFQDLAPSISGVVGNAMISIILGSMFYNMRQDTSSFFGRSVLLFFTILTNTLLASFEGVQLWDHRPIVEKQYRFAFYRRSAEAVASMMCDLPNKIVLTAGFNIPFYFLANMRRTPAAFFTFYLFAFTSLLTGSMLYRTIGAISQTLTASIAPGSVFILLLVIYTGFVLPIPSMHPWLRWFNYINPVAYAFESLMVNEFDGIAFPCDGFIPEGSSYTRVSPDERICSTAGATAGSSTVDGSAYLAATFDYHPDRLWPNFGILLGLMVFLCCIYLVATENFPAQRTRGEVLVFRKEHMLNTGAPSDQETQTPEQITIDSCETSEHSEQLGNKGKQAATFLWDNLSYEIKSRKGCIRLLDDVEGWVEPGTLTALMGESGAGKTTLLNVLAARASVGTISGEMIVDARFENEGFARKIGYAQQQDVTLPTATVKEALVFNARLRQSSTYTDVDKLAYVDEVIAKLELDTIADAVIGKPGEGLNTEQRKRVTIGIELASRPELLLFLDEPTSGLDSSTAWSICKLLRKLADSGQAILCTIHQPSGLIFEMFDRLLFIQQGRPVYFGDVGYKSRTVIDYFAGHGLPPCASDTNPAEWLMQITSCSNANKVKDWCHIWATSAERRKIKESLLQRKVKLRASTIESSERISYAKNASSYAQQLYCVTRRNFQQDWRTPSYLHSKLFLAIGAVSRQTSCAAVYESDDGLQGLVNGFSFYMSANSLQGVQNQIFSVFLLFTLHSSLVQLIMPRFLDNRSLYELTDQPSRTYRWDVFIIANLISEIPSQTILAIIQFATWYYPVGMYKNALSTHALNERSGLMFLLLWSYTLFSSTFSQMVATVMPDAATGVNISSLLYSLSLIFCG